MDKGRISTLSTEYILTLPTEYISISPTEYILPMECTLTFTKYTILPINCIISATRYTPSIKYIPPIMIKLCKSILDGFN